MEITEEDKALFADAIAAMAHAYAPYSQFPVGAALRTASGNVFSGCNVENVATPNGICAEATAVVTMVAAGEQEIAAVAVVAEKKPHVTPCGTCRQRLAEFAAPETRVVLGDLDGPKRIVTLGDLLPMAFNKTAMR